jgi:hypothetical protein
MLTIAIDEEIAIALCFINKCPSSPHPNPLILQRTPSPAVPPLRPNRAVDGLTKEAREDEPQADRNSRPPLAGQGNIVLQHSRHPHQPPLIFLYNKYWQTCNKSYHFFLGFDGCAWLDMRVGVSVLWMIFLSTYSEALDFL